MDSNINMSMVNSFYNGENYNHLEYQCLDKKDYLFYRSGEFANPVKVTNTGYFCRVDGSYRYLTETELNTPLSQKALENYFGKLDMPRFEVDPKTNILSYVYGNSADEKAEVQVTPYGYFFDASGSDGSLIQCKAPEKIVMKYINLLKNYYTKDNLNNDLGFLIFRDSKLYYYDKSSQNQYLVEATNYGFAYNDSNDNSIPLPMSVVNANPEVLNLYFENVNENLGYLTFEKGKLRYVTSNLNSSSFNWEVEIKDDGYYYNDGDGDHKIPWTVINQWSNVVGDYFETLDLKDNAEKRFEKLFFDNGKIIYVEGQGGSEKNNEVSFEEGMYVYKEGEKDIPVPPRILKKYSYVIAQYNSYEKLGYLKLGHDNKLYYVLNGTNHKVNVKLDKDKWTHNGKYIEYSCEKGIKIPSVVLGLYQDVVNRYKSSSEYQKSVKSWNENELRKSKTGYMEIGITDNSNKNQNNNTVVSNFTQGGQNVGTNSVNYQMNPNMNQMGTSMMNMNNMNNPMNWNNMNNLMNPNTNHTYNQNMNGFNNNMNPNTINNQMNWNNMNNQMLQNQMMNNQNMNNMLMNNMNWNNMNNQMNWNNQMGWNMNQMGNPMLQNQMMNNQNMNNMNYQMGTQFLMNNGHNMGPLGMVNMANNMANNMNKQTNRNGYRSQQI